MLIALLAGAVILACGLVMVLLHALCLVAGRADERAEQEYKSMVCEDEERAGE